VTVKLDVVGKATQQKPGTWSSTAEISSARSGVPDPWSNRDDLAAAWTPSCAQQSLLRKRLPPCRHDTSISYLNADPPLSVPSTHLQMGRDIVLKSVEMIMMKDTDPHLGLSERLCAQLKLYNHGAGLL
jgi:hypothetical protein